MGVRRFWFLFPLIIGLLGSGAALADQRIALVMGNGAYRHADALANPVQDARALAETLDRLDFDVDFATDLDQRDLQSALREFGRRAESADVALIFYAGHGIQVAGENYILPVDAQLERERDLIYESMPLTILLGEVALAKRIGIVILDACRDNPLANRLRQSLGPVRSRLIGTGLARIDTLPSDTLVAFSTRPGDIAMDGDGDNSPYLRALLQHIEEPGLELSLMFRKVRDTVLAMTGQRQEPRAYDALGAEPFYFVRPNRPPVIASAAPLTILDNAGATPLRLPIPTDPDGDELTVEIAALPRGGVVAAGGETIGEGERLGVGDLTRITFDPAGDVTGAVGALELRIRDGRGGTAATRLPVTIEPSNRPPRVTAAQGWRMPPIPLNIPVPVDPDGDPLEIVVTEVPREGVVRSGEVAVTAGQQLTLDQLESLVLDAATGSASGRFAFEVDDGKGAVVASSISVEMAAPTIEASVEAPEVDAPSANVVTAAAPVATQPPRQLTPDVTPNEADAPQVSYPAPFRTLRTSNIRAGPSAQSGRVSTVTANTELMVYGKPDGYDWYRVETPDGRKGYIFSGLVTPLVDPQTRGNEGGAKTDPRGGKNGPAALPEPEAEPQADPEADPASVQVAQLGATRALGRRIRDCATCPELIGLEGGSFVMGSDFGHRSERPTREVSLGAFAIGKYEVRVGEWRACVAAGGCRDNPDLDGVPDDVPAHDLSWADAQDYVAWLRDVTGEAYRLPSEAEWEFAARGGTTTRFWWGDEGGSGHANCRNCGGPYDQSEPAAVGAFAANPFGLHGVSGGVLEWVADCWTSDHTGAPGDGRARTEQGCGERVLRGGSWQNDVHYATSTSRLGYNQDVRYTTNGLRVARDLN